VSYDGYDRYNDYADEADVQRLRDAVATLQSDLSQLTSLNLPELSSTVEEVEGNLDHLTGRVDDARDDLAQHQRQVEELTRTVNKLKSSMQWIERHLRSSDTTPVVDLDTISQDLRTAAYQAEAGESAESELLDDTTVHMLTSHVQQHDRALEHFHTTSAALLTAADELTQLDWADESADLARMDYQQARTAWAKARDRLRSTTAMATKARETLAEDQTRRDANADVIAQGQKASATLYTRLRTRIADAVLDDILMPHWLHESLGAPPTSVAEKTKWIDVATRILAYRITYEDQHPRVAISELPADASLRRITRAGEIERDINNLQD
jgi:DNA repair exonuclease SbcCD ATPase subunit